MQSLKQPSGQIRGFTLVELLVAIALGAFLITISITLYQTILKAQLTAAQSLAITQKLIVSRHAITTALDGAITPCTSAPKRISLVRANHFWLQHNRAIAEVSVAGDALSGLKPIGRLAGERHPASDVLIVRPARLPATAIVAHDSVNNAFVIQNPIGLTRGDLAIICNQHIAVVFQVARVTTKRIYYVGTNISPGNCPNAFTSPDCGGDYVWTADTLLAHYHPTVFYIGNGSSGLALYRQQPTVFHSGNQHRLALRAQQLVEGVTQLNVAVSNTAGNTNPNAIAVRLTLADISLSANKRYEKHAFTVPLPTP